MAVNKKQMPFINLPEQASSAVENLKTQVQRWRGWVSQVDAHLDQLERKHLNPILDQAIVLWGDRRQQQRQALLQSNNQATGDESVTPQPRLVDHQEQQINRGLYVSIGSLGIALLGKLLFPPLQLLSLPGFLYGSLTIYADAYESLVKKRTVDLNLLIALANTAYLSGGWWVLGNANVTFNFGLAKLRSLVKERFGEDLLSALSQHPQQVWLLLGDQEVKSPLADVKRGDMVVVRAGEIIPVDGVVQEGIATVDQHALTGESQPLEKSVGDEVFALTLLLTGKLCILVEQSGSETTIAKINEVLAQTVDFRSTRQLQVEEITDQLVFPTLGLSALTYPFLGFSSALAVLNCHPFRKLNGFGSLGMLNYLVSAAEHGILIKDARSLELLGKVDTLVFDKTGTLTQEQPQVCCIHLCAESSEEQLLAYAASAEQRQSHPLARAILAEAEARGITLAALDQASYQVGFGLSVLVEGRLVQIGSRRFIEMQTLAIPPGLTDIQERSQQQGHSLTWVALDGNVIGAIECQAVLRPESKRVIQQLRQRKQLQQVIVLSGDQPGATEQLAVEIGADAWYAEVLPAAKAEWITRWQSEGRTVCFIGDGINDTVALKQANVSISLQGATSAATDTAHIVLIDESLQHLLPLFTLVDKFDSTLRDTMWVVLGTNVLGLAGIYLLGWGLPVITVLAQGSLVVGTGVVMQPRVRD